MKNNNGKTIGEEIEDFVQCFKKDDDFGKEYLLCIARLEKFKWDETVKKLENLKMRN